MSSSTALTVVLSVSWLLLFCGLFVYDKLSRKVVALQLQQQYVIRTVQAIAKKLDVAIDPDMFTQELLAFLQAGKTYEALTAYRTVKGVSYQEAKLYIDSLRSIQKYP